MDKYARIRQLQVWEDLESKIYYKLYTQHELSVNSSLWEKNLDVNMYTFCKNQKLVFVSEMNVFCFTLKIDTHRITFWLLD